MAAAPFKKQLRGARTTTVRRKVFRLFAALLAVLAGFFFFDGPGRPLPPDGKTPREAPDATNAHVLDVPDGDTVVVRTGSGKTERVRLYGVDAPELHQRGGKAAAAFAERLLRSRRVFLRTMERDQYGRSVALLILENGASVNGEIVRAGHAWVYSAYCVEEPACGEWRAHEQEARRERRGLWRDENPTPPWQWRREHPRR